MKTQKLIIISLLLLCVSNFCAQDLKDFRWTSLSASGSASGRHENAFVQFEDKFYLIGGRGVLPVNVFDPVTKTWEEKKKTPIELHHFQGVVYKDAIYLMGAMTGKYPKERSLENIWIYHPHQDTWEKGPSIPEARRRGSSGAVLYGGKIYMVCGIEYGHTSGTNNYFDSYDPETGEWEILTKAPHIRDHFSAIVVDDNLYCIGGRNTSVHYPNNFAAFFNATTPYVDVYNFTEGKWTTLRSELPVPTAAGGIVQVGNNLLYIGGEGSQKQAYNTTQCLNLASSEWSELAPLNVGRHGSSAIPYKGDVYIAAGSQVKGGGNMNSVEVFSAKHEWVSLFNGENLEGWTVKCIEEEKELIYWTVKDQCICGNSLNSKDHDYFWLQSNEEYENFELRLKYQVSRTQRGNSGVQIRSRYDDTNGYLDGPQIDIEPSHPWRSGLVYDETRGVNRWISPSLSDWCIAREDNPMKKAFQYFADEQPGWNDMTIICKGNQIKTIVNNLVVADYDGTGVLDDAIHKQYSVGTKGHIALQLHKNMRSDMRFKDIEIRILD